MALLAGEAAGAREVRVAEAAQGRATGGHKAPRGCECRLTCLEALQVSRMRPCTHCCTCARTHVYTHACTHPRGLTGERSEEPSDERPGACKGHQRAAQTARQEGTALHLTSLCVGHRPEQLGKQCPSALFVSTIPRCQVVEELSTLACQPDSVSTFKTTA